MIRCPSPRKAMLSSTASLGAGTMKLCSRTLPDSGPEQLANPPVPAFDAVTARLPAPPTTKRAGVHHSYGYPPA